MNIKAIIFDAGGVLHSSENHHMYEDIKKMLGISDEQFEQHYPELVELAVVGDITEDEFWQRFMMATGSKAQLPSESLFKRHYKKRFKAHVDVLNVVKKLKAEGYKVAVLSDTIPSHYQVNQEYGLYDDFPIQTFSFQVGVKKPDESIYTMTLDKLGCKPSEAIFIDDKQVNVVAAEKIGIHGIQFTGFEQLKYDLAKHGVS